MNVAVSAFVRAGMPSLFQAIFASVFIALCAQIRISLPFTPIPITVQTLGLMLVGVTLGSRKGVWAILFYLIQGCLGAPVWAGGVGGFMNLLGPRGGYLMSYPLEVYLIGRFSERQDRKALSLFVLFVFSVSIQLGIGSMWLSQFVGLDRCLLLGFYPFFLVELAKVCFVMCYLKFQKKQFDQLGALS